MLGQRAAWPELLARKRRRPRSCGSTAASSLATAELGQQNLDGAARRFIQEVAAVIAHCHSAIREADTIVVMHDGRIVEQGTHEALMARRGRYFALATARWRSEAAV